MIGSITQQTIKSSPLRLYFKKTKQKSTKMIVENDSFFFGSNERWDLMFWICAFLMNTALFATNLHQLTCLADLEDDYMNPFETAGRVNAWIMPEFYLQGFFCAYFLVTGHWFLFLCAFPLLCYHVNMVIKRQHMLDVTEVFRNIKFEKRMRIVKMGFYVFPFFIIMIKIFASINIYPAHHEFLEF